MNMEQVNALINKINGQRKHYQTSFNLIESQMEDVYRVTTKHLEQHGIVDTNTLAQYILSDYDPQRLPICSLEYVCDKEATFFKAVNIFNTQYATLW